MVDGKYDEKETMMIPARIRGPSRPGCLPARLLHIMMLLTVAFKSPGEFSCVDAFAGERAISKAFVGGGEAAVALDILISPSDDT